MGIALIRMTTTENRRNGGMAELVERLIPAERRNGGMAEWLHTEST
jgi:hypothetical protein